MIHLLAGIASYSTTNHNLNVVICYEGLVFRDKCCQVRGASADSFRLATTANEKTKSPNPLPNLGGQA